jgi:ubiquinone/menaquinone biosynthesis C-methylase UbiE
MGKKIFEHSVERSTSSHAILEKNSRKRKATKIKAILAESTVLSEAKVLDIGTGSGDIAYELSKFVKEIHSVDIVDERKEKSGYKFKLTADETIPYTDGLFDIVITNHVIEHTPNQTKHIDEILRVLKPKGCIYLATPNKFWVTDPHYKLPFISWLPRRVSTQYLKLIQKKDWDIYPLSARKLKQMVNQTGARSTNALPLLISGKAAKELDTWNNLTKLASIAPRTLLGLTQYVSPTLIYVFKKDD